MKRPLIAELAKQKSFEEIYKEMADKKMESDVIAKDIQALEKQHNTVKSMIAHLNNIALAKRRALVNKK